MKSMRKTRDNGRKRIKGENKRKPASRKKRKKNQKGEQEKARFSQKKEKESKRRTRESPLLAKAKNGLVSEYKATDKLCLEVFAVIVCRGYGNRYMNGSGSSFAGFDAYRSCLHFSDAVNIV